MVPVAIVDLVVELGDTVFVETAELVVVVGTVFVEVVELGGKVGGASGAYS